MQKTITIKVEVESEDSAEELALALDEVRKKVAEGYTSGQPPYWEITND